MKKLLLFLMLLSATSVSAQDVIVKKDGSTIVCRVVELTSTEIVYKRWSDLNGSNYVMSRADASAINYENGKKVNLSEAAPNLYLPNNQNDGTQQLNDRALLALDAKMNSFKGLGKAKQMKRIAWIGGAVLVSAGAIVFLSDDVSETNIIGAGLAIGGVVWTGGFLLAANHYQRIANGMNNYSLFQYDFKLSNDSSLSFGADMLRDQTNGYNTFGLGLRYNF